MSWKETNWHEWFEMEDQRKREQEQFAEWLDERKANRQFKRCPHCGQNYTFGYPPVEDDPGACQHCRGAEGELIL